MLWSYQSSKIFLAAPTYLRPVLVGRFLLARERDKGLRSPHNVTSTCNINRLVNWLIGRLALFLRKQVLRNKPGNKNSDVRRSKPLIREVPEAKTPRVAGLGSPFLLLLWILGEM
jgi:hypothetical protein